MLNKSLEMFGAMEINQWIADFEGRCQWMSAVDLADCLVMIGPDSGAGDCWCDDPEEGLVEKQFACLEVFHKRHCQINQVLHRIMVNNDRLHEVRDAIERDLRHEEPRIVEREYGEKLLTHFLKDDPCPTWVDPAFASIIRELMEEIQTEEEAYLAECDREDEEARTEWNKPKGN